MVSQSTWLRGPVAGDAVLLERLRERFIGQFNQIEQCRGIFREGRGSGHKVALAE